MEDAVGRCAQFPDDLAIVRIVAALERPPGGVDIAQTLRDLLTFGLGDPKRASSGGWRVRDVEGTKPWLDIPMSFPAGVGHVLKQFGDGLR
jgi:hypothetical protein